VTSLFLSLPTTRLHIALLSSRYSLSQISILLLWRGARIRQNQGKSHTYQVGPGGHAPHALAQIAPSAFPAAARKTSLQLLALYRFMRERKVYYKTATNKGKRWLWYSPLKDETRNGPQPCSPTLGQVDWFSWKTLLSQSHPVPPNLKTTLSQSHPVPSNLKTPNPSLILSHLIWRPPCRGVGGKPKIIAKRDVRFPIPPGKAFFRWTWTSIWVRVKRRPRSRRALKESDQISTDFVLFQCVILERGSFFPSFFHFFWDRTSSLSSLSDLRSEGNWRVKPRYSGSCRPGNAENLVRCQKKWGGKEENGKSDIKIPRMSDLKSNGEIDMQPWYADGRPFQEAKNLVRFQKKWKKRVYFENWVSWISPNTWQDTVFKWTHRLLKEGNNLESNLYCSCGVCYPWL